MFIMLPVVIFLLCHFYLFKTSFIRIIGVLLIVIGGVEIVYWLYV